MQLLRGTPATISQQFTVDGNAADPGEVLVTVTRLDGTAIATDAATDGDNTEPRTFALTTSDTAPLDTLTAEWVSPTLGTLTSVIEVVGALLFTEAEARAGDLSTSNPLTNAELYTDAVLRAAHARIEELFREACGVSFIPRYERVVTSGGGRCDLLIPDAMRVTAIRSIETRQAQTWTAFTEAELADTLLESWGRLTRESSIFPRGIQNVRIGYEHGWTRPPAEIRHAALLLLRSSVVPSNIDSRATSMSDGVMTLRFVTPGLTRGAFTSVPEVNAALQQFSERVPGIG